MPGLNNPKKIFNKSIDLLKNKGFFITTLSDDISLFSEKLRFLLSHIILFDKNIKNKNFEYKSIYLSKIFSSHLKTLNAKTRNSKIWVQDNILHYSWMGKKKYFSFEQAYKILNSKKKKSFLINKTSPDFNTDYQWYKKWRKEIYNKNYYKNFLKNKLNFLHVNEKFNNYDLKTINKICKKIIFINSLINKTKENVEIKKQILKKINYCIKKISKDLNTINKNNLVSLSLNEFNVFLNKYIYQKKIELKHLKKFKGFWGHGTYQISIQKI